MFLTIYQKYLKLSIKDNLDLEQTHTCVKEIPAMIQRITDMLAVTILFMLCSGDMRLRYLIMPFLFTAVDDM